MSIILLICAFFILVSWAALVKVCPEDELKELGMNFIPPLVAAVYVIAAIHYLF